MKITIPRFGRQVVRASRERQILDQARRQIFGTGRGDGLDLSTLTGQAAALPILAGAVSCLQAIDSPILAGGAR